MLKKILAIIRPQRAPSLCRALMEAECVVSLEAGEVMGTKGKLDARMAIPFAIEALPMVKIECAVEAEDLDAVMDIFLNRCRTGRNGDGKIFIYPMA